MAWSAVSWAYKDVITSAKLAQMVENVRVHDHATTDQGQRLGLLGVQNFLTGASNSTTSPVTVASITVTIPTGLTAGRSVLLIAQARVTAPAGVAATVDISNTGGQPVATGTGVLDYYVALVKPDATPVAGSRTYNLTITSGTAGQSVGLSRGNMAAILL